MSTSPTTGKEPDSHIDISVVIPCLNEARTVGDCVAAAWDGIRESGLHGEVVVADNGSTDGSREIAERVGARVVPVPRRGYGAALQAGFRAARGRLLVMGDADLSYDFRDIPKFVAEQGRTGADVVVGDRLHGRIDPGAMPWTHRHIGNPLISFTIRRLFRVPVNDCYCGLRMITREGFQRLRLNAPTMVFALEMIVQARLVGLSFSQVPITLHVDGRDHAPHLRTMRDGYRSFRFIFQHAPITAYVVPGVLAALAGFVLLGFELGREVRGARPSSAMVAGSTELIFFGWLVVVLGIIARVFVVGFLDSNVDPSLRRFFSWFSLETAVLLSGVSIATGMALGIGFRALPVLLQLGLTLCVIGVGTVVAAFVVSLIGRAIPDDRFAARASEPAAPSPGPAPPASRTGMVRTPPEEHTTREARIAATQYQHWMVDLLQPAWLGSSRLLTVDPAGVFTATVAGRAHEGWDQSGVALDSVADLAELEEMEASPPFDSVLVFNALANVTDDVEALRSLARRVRPGGRLGMILPAGGDRLYGPIDERIGRLRRYRPARLDQRLQMAGLQAESIRWVDAAGALAWFCKVRLQPSTALSAGDIQRYERVVPLIRRLDAVTGPPFGRLLAAVARVPDAEPPAAAGAGRARPHEDERHSAPAD